MIKISSQFSLILLLFAGSTANAADFISAKVTSVIDGNTIEITIAGGETQRIILAGIDCPELSQEFGTKARDFVEKLILNKMIIAKVTGKDKKGNNIGIIMVDNKDLREYLLQEGLAWTLEKDPAANLESMKESAQQDGIGLWSQKNPMAPWLYRRQQSMMEPKSSF